MLKRASLKGLAVAAVLAAAVATSGPAAAADAPAWKSQAGKYAVFDTSEGKIVCRLFDKEAPKTVENFTGLAAGTKEFTDPTTRSQAKRPFYDGTKFHRVIPGFMMQGGDPLGTGVGGPGFTIDDEFVPTLTFAEKGMLAMANTGRPHTGGSQFFITTAPTTWLNGKHTIFGKVVEGQDVVDKIKGVRTGKRGFHSDVPVEDVVIQKAEVV